MHIATPLLSYSNCLRREEIVTPLTSFHNRIGKQKKRETLLRELQEALAELEILEKILPICSVCRKIRQDNGTWTEMEPSLSRYAGVGFSHGYCPECYEKALDEIKNFTAPLKQ